MCVCVYVCYHFIIIIGLNKKHVIIVGLRFTKYSLKLRFLLLHSERLKLRSSTIMLKHHLKISVFKHFPQEICTTISIIKDLLNLIWNKFLQDSRAIS